MKDWKTWAIVALAAWCALLTYFPIASHIKKQEFIRTQNEKVEKRHAEFERELAKRDEEMTNHRKAFLERLKKNSPERFTDMTNRLHQTFPERYKQNFGSDK